MVRVEMKLLYFPYVRDKQPLKAEERSAIYKLDFSGGSDGKVCVCRVENPVLMQTAISDPRFSRHHYKIKTKKTIAGHIISK